jgi:hypothetical protein
VKDHFKEIGLSERDNKRKGKIKTANSRAFNNAMI